MSAVPLLPPQIICLIKENGKYFSVSLNQIGSSYLAEVSRSRQVHTSP
jgi:hypothetical protein